MSLLAIDTGYSNVKVAFPGKDGKVKTLKFPTAVSQRAATGITFGENKYLSYQGYHFLVGETALKISSKILQTDSDDFSVIYSPLLVYEAIRRSGVKPEVLCLSIALTEVGRRISFYDPFKGEVVEGVKDELMKEYCSSFEVNGEKVEIPEIEVFPQGVGIWLDVGKPRDCIIIDIGDRTVDVVAIADGELLPYPYSFGESDIGTKTLAEYLQKAIEEEYGVFIDLNKVKRALEDRYVVIKGKRVFLGDLINSYAPVYTKTVMNRILRGELKGFYETTGNLYIAGGGAYFFPKEILEELGAIVPEQPEFSNVRGFLKILSEGDSE